MCLAALSSPPWERSISSGCTVSVKNLVYRYGGGADKPAAVDGISFEVAAGERLAIIGASGAGKSTFLLHLNGVLLPASGHIEIGGLAVEPANLREIRRRAGIVFQNPDDQLFTPTVEEDIAFGPLNMGLSRDEVRGRVTKALEQMRLAGYEKRSTHELSFGEKRRVSLATVLAMSPEVIGFDEPFANLDPGMVEQLIDVIRALPATVILVSQEILPAIACADRIAVFHRGQLAAIGPAMEIAANRPLLAQCGVDFHYQGHIWDRLHGR